MRGMKLGLKIARTEPLASMLDHNDKHDELDHALHLKSDAELAQIARERVETLYHPASSCRMAPLEAGGVVDAAFKVHGITGLRVCDASVFPSIVSGHTVRGRLTTTTFYEVLTRTLGCCMHCIR